MWSFGVFADCPWWATRISLLIFENFNASCLFVSPGGCWAFSSLAVPVPWLFSYSPSVLARPFLSTSSFPSALPTICGRPCLSPDLLSPTQGSALDLSSSLLAGGMLGPRWGSPSVSLASESIVLNCLLSGVWRLLFISFVQFPIFYGGKVCLITVSPSWSKAEVEVFYFLFFCIHF